MWKDYAKEADFVIFVVDSTDTGRMNQAKDLLWTVLESIPKKTSIVVFCNKQDFFSAASCANIANDLNLNSITDRKWYIQAGCALTGDGIYESIDHILTFFVPQKIDFFGKVDFNIASEWEWVL